MPTSLYTNFLQKWTEVVELPPQTVGPLTPVYKRAVPFLKVDPWRVLLPLSLILIVAIVLFLEATAVQITSILQRGF